MIYYKKQVEIRDTSAVLVSVYRMRGTECLARIGFEYFAFSIADAITGSQRGLVKRLQKAHKWADERILIAGQYEKTGD